MYTVYSVQSLVYSVQCTVYLVQCTIKYTVECKEVHGSVAPNCNLLSPEGRIWEHLVKLESKYDYSTGECRTELSEVGK